MPLLVSAAPSISIPIIRASSHLFAQEGPSPILLPSTVTHVQPIAVPVPYYPQIVHHVLRLILTIMEHV